MNTNSALDHIDEYVDALLGNAIETATPGGSPPGEASVAPPINTIAAAIEPAVRVDARPAPLVPEPAARIATPIASTPAVLPVAAALPPRTASLPASHRWLRVAVGSDSYALELLCVQEVVRVAPIVAMRGAGRSVLGVMNLRGRIVPVFDLGLWLGTACVRPGENSRIVVVERDDELIGVLVTQVEDVVTLGRDRIEPPLPGTGSVAVLGVARVGAAPTVLLDAGALFAGE